MFGYYISGATLTRGQALIKLVNSGIHPLPDLIIEDALIEIEDDKRVCDVLIPQLKIIVDGLMPILTKL